jgi:hypothetical protein
MISLLALGISAAVFLTVSICSFVALRDDILNLEDLFAASERNRAAWDAMFEQLRGER